MMKTLERLFPEHKVGYSDHTAGILAPVAAVAVGACVIEKHFTLDREKPIRNYLTGRKYLGTDHVLSVEPAELREMVRQIRQTEEMMGGFKWERSDGEKILRSFLRNRFKNKV
jgi:N,N'-diacetyllegionaminate synthase